MSKPEFTPGPWEVNKRIMYSHEIKSSLTRELLADVFLVQHGDYEKNASLISAAPDMYEACKLMIDALGKLSGGLPDSTFTEPYFKMRNALTKAQGGVKE